jgi:hypothetical protein
MDRLHFTISVEDGSYLREKFRRARLATIESL